MSSTARNLWRRGSRTAPLWLAALVTLSSGCVATKKDVRTIQSDIAALREQHNRALADLQQSVQAQNRMLLDTVRISIDATRTARGDLSNQLRELRETVRILEALLAQLQQRITDAQRQAEMARQEQARQPVNPPSRTNPDDLYQQAQVRIADKSWASARLLLEQIVSDFPDHPRAADAQYYLGEIAFQEQEYAEAMTALEAVWQRYPNSPRAPSAMYRAGEAAEAARDRVKAREFYQLVVTRHRNSDEASRAAARLRALR